MFRKYIAIGIFVVLTFNINAQIYNYCEQLQSNVLSADLPILPNTFNVRVEANHVTRQHTSDSFEVYDGVRRKASVQLFTRNLEIRYVFDYPLNEVHRIERMAAADDFSGAVCESEVLVDSTATSEYFGYFSQNSSYIVPGSQYDFFRFPRTGQVYNGTDTIRGIPCDVYLSCQTNQQLKANYRVKFYISQTGYQMPYFSSTYKQSPVRAEVEGIYYDNNVRTNFRTIYDYHEFDPEINEYAASFFSTPSGVICKNRKNIKATPKVSERYAYSEEIVRDKTILNLKKLYYDSLFKLVRYDLRNTQKQPETFYVLDPLTIINDYSTGIGYHINRNYGNCSRRGLGFGSFGYDFESDKNFTEQSISQGLGVSVKLKSPSSFLSLDGNYTFMGERFESEIPVDLFIANHTEELGGSGIFSSLFEYTFRMPFSAAAARPRTVPVRLSVMIPSDPGQNSQFNYYNFESDLPDYSVFDTTGCHSPENVLNFRISFSYYNILTANDFRNSFVQFMEQFLFYVLTAELNETAMRFKPPKISVGYNGTFYAVSSILPPVPPLDLYKKWEGKWLLGTNFVSAPVDSARDCAVFCNNQQLCLSFDYCADTGRCFANERHVTSNASNLGSSVCDHYSRTSESHVAMKDNSQIWTLLQNYVALGAFKIELPIPTPQGFNLVNFTATSVVQLEDVTNFGATSTMSRFDLAFKKSHYVTRKDRFYNGISVDQCAQNCLRESVFTCESFDYCYVSGECRTSRTQPTNMSDIEASDPCEIYTRDALYHYSQFAYAVSINTKDKRYDNINSAKECARLCDVEKSLHCRGFNFCGSTNACYLTETHTIDDGSSSQQVDLVCTHYTRNYLQDFSYTSSGNISTIAAEIILGESAIEECSRACVGADGFQCKSFDFCPRSRTCLLHSNDRAQVLANPNDRHVEACDNYIREFYFLTSSVINLKSKKTDNSEGVLTGLAVTFSILSAVGGFLLFMFVLPKLTKAK